MRILVYNGKHADCFWMADTLERTAGAQAALFKMLDEMGCYLDDERHLEKAREGNPKAINYILQQHSGYEYETWCFEEAEVIE